MKNVKKVAIAIKLTKEQQKEIKRLVGITFNDLEIEVVDNKIDYAIQNKQLMDPSIKA